MTVYASALPRGCTHCHLLVVPDGQGHWVHTNRSYACQDWTGVGIGRHATPKPPEWALTRTARDERGRHRWTS